MQQTVIVLGVARSGTSMVGGILHTLGVDMNPQDNPSEQNPKGSFEDIGFVTVTQQVAMDTNDGTINLRKKYGARIKALIEKRMERSTHWGWKSALTHRAIELFVPLVPNPRFVVTFREPLSNSQSWIEHMRVRYGQSVTLIDALSRIVEDAHQVVKAVERHPDVPSMFTSYERTREDPLREAQRMAEFLGITMSAQMQESIRELIDTNYTTIQSGPNLVDRALN